MNFREIYMYLKYQDFPELLTGAFELQARSLGYFLEREIRKEKIPRDIKGVILIGAKNTEAKCELSVTNKKYLEIELPFPEQDYSQLSSDKLNKYFYDDMMLARKLDAEGVDIVNDKLFPKFPESDYAQISIKQVNEFFIDMLRQGFQVCEGKYDLPVEAISQKIDEFRQADYKNEWVFRRKRIKGTKLICEFYCKWTIAYFSMDLNIYQGDKQVFSEEVLYTIPSENTFATKYKRIDIQDNKIILIDKFDYEVYEKDFSEFL